MEIPTKMGFRVRSNYEDVVAWIQSDPPGVPYPKNRKALQALDSHVYAQLTASLSSEATRTIVDEFYRDRGGPPPGPPGPRGPPGQDGTDGAEGRRGKRGYPMTPKPPAGGAPHEEAGLPQGAVRLPQEGAQGAWETQAEAVAWTQTLLVVTPNQIREVRAPLIPQRYLQAVPLRQPPAQALLLWRATR